MVYNLTVLFSEMKKDTHKTVKLTACGRIHCVCNRAPSCRNLDKRDEQGLKCQQTLWSGRRNRASFKTPWIGQLECEVEGSKLSQYSRKRFGTCCAYPNEKWVFVPFASSLQNQAKITCDDFTIDKLRPLCWVRNH